MDTFEDRLHLLHRLRGHLGKPAGDGSTRKAIEDISSFFAERSNEPEVVVDLAQLLLDEMRGRSNDAETMMIFLIFEGLSRRQRALVPLFGQSIEDIISLLCPPEKEVAQLVATLLKLTPGWAKTGLLPAGQVTTLEEKLREHPSYDERVGRSIPLPSNRRDILASMEKSRTQQKNAREAFSTLPSDADADAESDVWWRAACAARDAGTLSDYSPFGYFQSSGVLPDSGIPSTSSFTFSQVNIGNAGRPVFVWDLDETLITFQSLLSHSSTSSSPSNGAHRPFPRAKELEETLFTLLETHFFWRDLEPLSHIPSLEIALRHDDGASLSHYDFATDAFDPTSSSRDNLRKAAYRFRRISELYADTAFWSRVLSSGPFSKWRSILADVDKATQGRLAFVQNLLDGTKLLTGGGSAMKAANVIVTSSSLLSALAKCVLFGLSSHFSAHDVFSSCGRGSDKLMAFRMVKQRYGGACDYLVVGDGPEEEEAAGKMKWAFHRVKSQADLVLLYNRYLDR